MTTLQLTHLRFDCVALSDVHLGGPYAGNNLRNALANVMLHATCPETHRRAAPTPEHAATCPACWLLAAEIDPGSVVRAYAVAPPLPAPQRVADGEPFAFGLTLFGDGLQFFPYVVLAAAEMGRVGVGQGRRDGYGRFALSAIWAFDPLTGRREQLLAASETLVRVPQVLVTWSAVAPVAEQMAARLSHGGDLALHFLTPLRLVEDRQLFEVPDFGVFFQRLLLRIDDLGRQYAGEERRDREEVRALQQLADQVRLVKSDARWLDLWSWSGRKQGKTPLGGLVGAAVYRAKEWGPLLPWLIWGQAVQAGKSTVKGNGVYALAAPPAAPAYWDHLRAPSPLAPSQTLDNPARRG